jgi:hypothetical protein
MKKSYEERSLIETIRKRQKQWIGHVTRHDSLLKSSVEGRVSGKKYRCRPRKMMLDWLQEGRGC